MVSSADVVAFGREVQGLSELAHAAGVPTEAPPALLAAGIDFVLEGLYALKKIGRSDERGYQATETPVRRPSREVSLDDETPVQTGSGKKKYYN